jgi:hypothetical protein
MEHNMEKRIQDLYDNFNNMSQAAIKQSLEKWDRDQGRAMKQSPEAAIEQPRRSHAWSPALRNAGIIKKYWRLRLKETTIPNTNYAATILRLQHSVQQQDPKFILPHTECNLTAAEVRKHLNAASRQLHLIQMASSDNRFKAYQDILAVYQSDKDPETRPDSIRKAKIVKRTIRTEKIRAMFSNIRTTVRGSMPTRLAGINQIKIPVIPGNQAGSEPNTDEFHEYLTGANPNDIVWDTVLDPESVERYLLSYNRKSFQSSSCIAMWTLG